MAIEANISASPEGDEFSTTCSCCGQKVHWGHGWLDSAKGPLAAYWYHWHDGHQGHFDLALARFDEIERLVPGVASVSAKIDGDAIRYSLLEPDQTSWHDLSRFGPLLSRDAALKEGTYLFELVDAIVANDHRLVERILVFNQQAE